MSHFGGCCGPTWLAFVGVVVVVVAAAAQESSSFVPSSPTTAAAPSSVLPLQSSSSSSSRGPDRDDVLQEQKQLQGQSQEQQEQQFADPEDTTPVGQQVVAKDTSLAEADNKGQFGHTGHSGHSKPMKTKKKKPMGKHKKKKQTFKDKLLPLLLIPFVIQTMLIPMFIMNLKMLAMKAMTVGKFAILLIAFNMFRSWSQNAHSTSIRGTMNSLMAHNYGYNGGPEIGAFFNGR